MEELVVLENEQSLKKVSVHQDENGGFLEIDGHFFDYVDLLDSASKLAYSSGFDVKQKLLLVDLAISIAPSTKELGFMEHAVRHLILINHEHDKPNEFHIHKLAKQNLSKVITGLEIIEKNNNPKHQPDLWAKRGNEEIPVEIKLNGFNSKALNQLKRYMKFYECNQGLAIGESLDTELPKNIQFISIKELERSN